MMKDNKTAPQAWKEIYFFDIREPNIASKNVLMAGINGMSQNKFVISSLHQFHIFALDGFALPVDQQDNR